MDITIAGNAVDYSPTDDQLSRTSIELAAMDGEVGNGIFPITDDFGIATYGGRQFKVEEGDTVISNGFQLDEDDSKGSQPAGPTVERGFGLMDANALLHGFRYERARPAETAFARVMASLGDLPVGTITTFVESSGDYTMPAKTYATDDGWDELITDIAEFTGKTTFLHDTADGDRCLHMHVLTHGHDCGLSISDVIGDYDGVTIFAPQNAGRTFTSVDLVNDIKGRDQAERTSSATDSASITAHDADGLQHQTLRDFEAGSQADLDQKVAVFLENQKDEVGHYSCTIGPLDEDALALIRVGDLITVTSYVMGLTEAVKRISHINLTPYIGNNGRARPGWWNASLEMGAPKRRRSRGKPTLDGVIVNDPTGDGGGGDGCCTPWACDNDFGVHTDGGAEVLACIFSGHGNGQSCVSAPGTANSDAMYVYNGATYRVDYEVFHAADSNQLVATLTQVGGTAIGSAGPPYVVGSGTVAPAVYMGDLARHCQFGPADDIPLASTVWTSAFDGYVQATLTELGCAAGDSFASSISAHITYLSGPDPRFEALGPCSNGLPDPGQPIHDAAESTTGDGSTTTDTTAHSDKFGYAPGSFVLSVNGLQPWPGVHELDPDAGTVTYDYPPPLGSDVVRLYDRGTLV